MGQHLKKSQPHRDSSSHDHILLHLPCPGRCQRTSFYQHQKQNSVSKTAILGKHKCDFYRCSWKEQISIHQLVQTGNLPTNPKPVTLDSQQDPGVAADELQGWNKCA